MASMALDAIVSGKIPDIDPAAGFLDTGATLVTDKPVTGVESIDTTKGTELCWG
jgi:fructose transport system substrate-binding protein